MLHWIFKTGFFEPDKMQRRAGWEYLLRQATLWDCEQRERARLEGVAWEAPIAGFEMDGFRVTPLASAVALWDEARAMSHCVDRYVEDSRDGLDAIFSVTRIGDGRRVATIGYRRSAGTTWQFFQACGHANRLLDPRLIGPIQRAIDMRLEQAPLHILAVEGLGEPRDPGTGLDVARSTKA